MQPVQRVEQAGLRAAEGDGLPVQRIHIVAGQHHAEGAEYSAEVMGIVVGLASLEGYLVVGVAVAIHVVVAEVSEHLHKFVGGGGRLHIRLFQPLGVHPQHIVDPVGGVVLVCGEHVYLAVGGGKRRLQHGIRVQHLLDRRGYLVHIVPYGHKQFQIGHDVHLSAAEGVWQVIAGYHDIHLLLPGVGGNIQPLDVHVGGGVGLLHALLVRKAVLGVGVLVDGHTVGLLFL